MTILLSDKNAGKIMNYTYLIFLLYSSFLITVNDENHNIDKLKIFVFMTIFNPLHSFILQINKIITIIDFSVIIYIKYSIGA